MAPPPTEPIGLQVTRTARVVNRAFDQALAEAGGSLPVWLVLMSLKAQSHRTQRDLAGAVGIEGPTLTHHLHRMEAAGLVSRTRDPGNRRVQQVALTDEGEQAFHRLRTAVVAFDRRLRTGLSDTDAAALEAVLTQLRTNVAPAGEPTPTSTPSASIPTPTPPEAVS